MQLLIRSFLYAIFINSLFHWQLLIKINSIGIVYHNECHRIFSLFSALFIIELFHNDQFIRVMINKYRLQIGISLPISQAVLILLTITLFLHKRSGPNYEFSRPRHYDQRSDPHKRVARLQRQLGSVTLKPHFRFLPLCFCLIIAINFHCYSVSSNSLIFIFLPSPAV